MMQHRRRSSALSSITLAIVLQLITVKCARAQSGLNLFRTDVVHEIAITINTPDWVAAVVSTYGLSDAAVLATVTIDGLLVDSVGVSTKGESSFFVYSGQPVPKLPFALDFNHYISTQRYDGLRSVNLNNAALDASYLHDALASRIFADLGIPGPRSGFAHVTMNGTSLGLYQVGERINKNFLDEHYNDNDGELWKSYICDWMYYGPDPNNYSPYMEVRQDPDGLSMSRLIGMFEAISQTTLANADDTLDAYLHMDEVLTVLAANVAMQAGDNATVHNWWLYREPQGDRYHYIPWDYNLAFDHVSDSAFDEITTWYYAYFPEPNWWGATRIGQLIIQNPDLKARFYEKLCVVRSTVIRAELLSAFVDSAYALLQPHVLADQIDFVTPGQYDSCYYADRYLYPNIFFLYDAWGIQRFLEQQGALIDSVLLARGISCGPLTVAPSPVVATELAVYPNPNPGLFQVAWPGHAGMTCALMDATGRTVWTGAGNENGLVVHLPEAAAGAYVLQVLDGAERRTEHVMVVR